MIVGLHQVLKSLSMVHTPAGWDGEQPELSTEWQCFVGEQESELCAEESFGLGIKEKGNQLIQLIALPGPAETCQALPCPARPSPAQPRPAMSLNYKPLRVFFP